MDGAAVTADRLGLKGPRGWAYEGVGCDAPPGSLVALRGPSGSGRTCLLLTLTGRMRPTTGHAEVAGERLPRRAAAVRRISALAHVPGVTDLDPALTVAEHLRERVLLQRRFEGSPRSLLRPRAARAADGRRRTDAALDAVGLDPGALPRGARTAVRDLERPQALRLSLALALIGGPRVLGVDDLDLKLTDRERAAAWTLLRDLADTGLTVLAGCGQPPAPAYGALVVPTRPSARPGAEAVAEDRPEAGTPFAAETRTAPEPGRKERTDAAA
ncbi:ATP-binding cassette domain-containing protein [Streptomyces sp. JNUCC 64]